MMSGIPRRTVRASRVHARVGVGEPAGQQRIAPERGHPPLTQAAGEAPGRGRGPLGPAERRLARDMKGYWGTCTLRGSPNGPGLARWPRYDGSGAVMSLRAGGHSRPISDAQYVAEHQCAFWDSLA
jgi:hypothetical protein